VVMPGTIKADNIPTAFRMYAMDFFEAYKSHTPTTMIDFSPAKYFLISLSIELAAKSLQLDNGENYEGLISISHDLDKACDRALFNKYGVSLTNIEYAELKKANKYHKNRGFEYYLFDYPMIEPQHEIPKRLIKTQRSGRSGPELHMAGWPDLPALQVLETILNKLLSAKLVKP